MKRLLTFFICTIVLMCTTNTFTANAKVLEPTLVSTESWTTSYYIDDDKNTLYPYIECKADIYSDGTVKCYFWNTHEWDGYATVSHKVTIINTIPYSTDSKEYAFKYTGDYTGKYNTHYSVTSTESKALFADMDMSYYSSDFRCDGGTGGDFRFLQDDETYTYYSEDLEYKTSIGHAQYRGALPELLVGQEKCVVTTFTPKVDVTKSYSFRFLGHDITVSPEILSGSIIATPQLSEQEKQIQLLEQENERLRAENERLTTILDVGSILRLDSDGNGIIDAKDATTILKIYAINSTGGNIKTLDDLKNYN